MVQRDCGHSCGDSLNFYPFTDRDSSSSWQFDAGVPQETWWNRSAGPLILTTLLAPLAWTLMLVGYTLSGLTVLLGMGYKHLQSVATYLGLSMLEQ